ncbi:hypothetical protein C3L33_22909, partial [Rhododendron williamsianum]
MSRSADWNHEDGIKCYDKTKPVMKKGHWGTGSNKAMMRVVADVVEKMRDPIQSNPTQPLFELADVGAVLPLNVVARWDKMLFEELIPSSDKFYSPFKDFSAMMVREEEGYRDSISSILLIDWLILGFVIGGRYLGFVEIGERERETEIGVRRDGDDGVWWWQVAVVVGKSCREGGCGRERLKLELEEMVTVAFGGGVRGGQEEEFLWQPWMTTTTTTVVVGGNGPTEMKDVVVVVVVVAGGQRL